MGLRSVELTIFVTYVFKTVSVPGAAEATWTPASVINAATRVDLVMMNCMVVLADCGCS